MIDAIFLMILGRLITEKSILSKGKVLEYPILMALTSIAIDFKFVTRFLVFMETASLLLSTIPKPTKRTLIFFILIL
jgi:hypothetical protein